MALYYFLGTLALCLTAAEGCLTFAYSNPTGSGNPYLERQMPIYEYECQTCGHRFEEWQKMSDKPIKVCPKCKARKVEKLISHTSFQLKGGGWYSDLYASQKPAAAPTGSPSSGEGKSGNEGGAAKASAAAGDGKGKGKKGSAKAAA